LSETCSGKDLNLDHAMIAPQVPQLATAEMPLSGPADHPMIDMPFHVEIDGRQYKGRGISLVRANVSGLLDPNSAGAERIAWVVFRFQGFTVALSIEVRMQDVDPARGMASLIFLEPLGDHLPQLRHLMNAYIAGDLVTLGNALAVSLPAGASAKPKAGSGAGWGQRLSGFGGGLLMLALTGGLVMLVAEKAFQRAFVLTLVTPAVTGFEGRTLAATATGQIDFLNPDAKVGEVAFAIRANTGQTLSVAMPCDCRVEALGIEAGSTVFAGDPILRLSAPDAPLVLTGAVAPEQVLDLAGAASIDLRFADGAHVAARLAPGGIATAAPGEMVPFRLIPDEPLSEDRLGQLAKVTLNRPVPVVLQPLASVSGLLSFATEAKAP
jgi:mannuronan synthase